MKLVVFTGLPCSGKSTIAKLCQELTKYPYISSGDIARNIAQTNKKVADDLSKGHMAPEDMMRSAINTNLFSIGDGRINSVVLMDGFPRNIPQLDYLRRCSAGITDITFINVEISIGTAFARAESRARNDDGVLAFSDRVDNYNRFTRPMLTEYKDKYTVINVPGDFKRCYSSDVALTLSDYIKSWRLQKDVIHSEH